ncbi:endonuclease YncB(thermonuclease family) [Azospirillum brasilense]|uniref:Endonuclease YncB(Thermonuclease family) n=1 Tax=Azospirillum brasilense TaxID=192 RepID=A0A560BNF8_AZOBR|nr:thermonuclease family protein [Azospirillum brasilense]TWA74143.1 endonuclease YncB(thermonuclease family) [Azospirillum brasilense]
MKFVTAAALFLLAAAPALAADLTGTASVVDGDTLEVRGTRIRLHGIDAPESQQLCQDATGKDWRCGQQAALALSDRIGRRPVDCLVKDTDRYGRSVAACSVGGESLNAWMAANGWAMAYRQYSKDYVGAEATARAARAGIWAGTFQPPWEWRAAKREGRPQAANQSRPAPAAAPTSIPPSGCTIKGNINSKGERVYHVPGGRSYDQTRIDTSDGERWFCSEDEAQAAGWRRAGQ